nr:alpha/beta hydrolase [Cellulomonas septica]
MVHGTWGNPDDWRWVRALLDEAGVDVVAPDLPSHRSDAGLAADAAEVRRTVQACRPPTVLVGWSYGGDVVGLAAVGATGVVGLVYVAAVPRVPDAAARDTLWFRDNPHVTVGEDGTFVLDDRWWREEEAGATFPPDVREHLAHHPRRPASLRVETERQVVDAAWVGTPTTVLLGRQDVLTPEAEQRLAADRVADVRLLDCDHFVLWRDPAAVSVAALDLLDGRSQTPG